MFQCDRAISRFKLLRALIHLIFAEEDTSESSDSDNRNTPDDASNHHSRHHLQMVRPVFLIQKFIYATVLGHCILAIFIRRYAAQR